MVGCDLTGKEAEEFIKRANKVEEEFLARKDDYTQSKEYFFLKNQIEHEKELKRNLKILEQLSNLDENWAEQKLFRKISDNKYFSEEHINLVKNVINTLQIQPLIFPTYRHSIQLEYEINNAYLEFEIYINKIDMYSKFHSNEIAREVSSDEINEITNEFFKKYL